MARTALRGRLSWLVAEVVELIDETPRVRSVVFDVPGWTGHLPGQHVDIRLTAEDGYQAQRSYSIAAPEDGDRVVITVERVDEGEVSPFLVEDLMVGDRIELRGPIGGYFVWEPGSGQPVQLLAGGSGIAPLMAMIRAAAASPGPESIRLLSSARTEDDLIYRKELDSLAERDSRLDITYTLTRGHGPGWKGQVGRVDRVMLERFAWPPEVEPSCYVCGPTGFVETVASILVDLGHPPDRVRTERFGPSGGHP
ncbi:MAG TPA: ferredoxin reductase [Acidimicrobiia bacterium]|jgi:ferredoxin-NADP reductase